MNGVGFINQMFRGVRIIEVAQFVSIPSASAVLCDLGAEVIHVENVGDDRYRAHGVADGGQCASELAIERDRRGKKSVAIDLKTEEGREFFLKLIETADIFLSCLQPAELYRLSLTMNRLRERNRRLIYAHGNGLGFRGAFGLAAALYHREHTQTTAPFDADTVTETPGRSPRFGEHTERVLRDLGIGPDYLKDCRTRKVVF